MKVMVKKKSDQPQVERFMETARMLGCDEDETAFEERLMKIAKPSPPKPEKKTPRSGGSGAS
jgi:hypothetical protein